ncbi:hypothetical protein D0C36_20345 [Mucilaginibacter conchicola]|uniref:Uncharacterized protein n=1 Tax=Mucilaginibacter conchicola TaxID=2303333 RepID=A0A372NSN3_9SPHI|nr:hypothetical protein [Mucilaginibacter conchicola]RFZ91283.1 hypothetical protein D0C36_20345 [Mucilaginibacter conchicola]
MILPDTLAHRNGHKVIKRSYNIYTHLGVANPELIEQKKKEGLLAAAPDNPDYLGVLKLDLPDKLFSYSSPQNGLYAEEVNELIELLSGIREDPSKWQ